MKKIFRKIHLYMALFTIPVGIMIALTGALYVLGADQDTGAKINTYTVNQIIPKGEEIEFLKQWTKENNVKKIISPKFNVLLRTLKQIEYGMFFILQKKL